MAAKLPMVLDCPTCGGKGEIPGPGKAAELASQREKAGVSVVALAEALGISDTYLRDIELGRRGLKAELAEQYGARLVELAGQ